ncbi:MAG: hypothetical protein ACLUKN_02675 [Bacilli bacterium]
MSELSSAGSSYRVLSFCASSVKYEFADAWRACVFATVLCTLEVDTCAGAARLKSSEAMRNE